MTPTTTASSVGDLATLTPSFERSLRAANKSTKTIVAYTQAADHLLRFLRQSGMPTEVSKIRREHVEAFIIDQLERWKPATANNRYRSLAQLFKWLEEEGEIRTSPMAKMHPPKVPEQQMPVLSDDDLHVLKACDGRDFVVLGKGRRPRSAPYGQKTAQAIDRYLRLRKRDGP